MQRRFPIRSVVMVLTAGACLIVGRSNLLGQNNPPQAPVQSDNPFPGEQPKTPDAPKPNAGQGNAKTQSTPAPPKTDSKTGQKPASDNPFPGEDTNAPIIPVDPGPGAAAGSDSGRAGREAAPPANATAASSIRRMGRSYRTLPPRCSRKRATRAAARSRG